MSTFFDELQESLGGGVTEQLQSNFNLKPEQATGVFDAVGPLVLSGLKRQKDEAGEGRLGDLLDEHGDADGIDDLGGYFKKAAGGLGVDLGGILGSRGEEAAGLMDKNLGLSPGLGAKLIPLLAPLIMGQLLKKRQSASDGQGGGLGMIGSLLDRDGDGNVLDDLGGMLFKGGLGSLAGGSTKSGCLGMLLGGRR